MKRVVSISLGSSTRDKVTEADFLGERFRLERVGTNGNLQKAAELIYELDGHVDCIGLGGMDRYLWLGDKRYAIRQVDRLARRAILSPVVDGSGLKHTLEPMVLQRLAEEGKVKFSGKRALLLSGVDRYGMAETLPRLGCEVIYGDLIYALGLPIALKSLSKVRLVGRTLLPVLCWLPMSFLYPTGSKQHKPPAKSRQVWLQQADIIAGDFLFLRRFLPDDLCGKTIITNTTTREDVQLLDRRRAQILVTTTPRLEGRSFGTNVMEGVLVVLSGQKPEELTEADYKSFIKRLDWKPEVEYLQSGGPSFTRQQG
ncbi:MAG: quinate 5-dehydrogenase [Armatimonadetes bacterium]|nr:quinate 5-dehydrogenase [Armatimonadota bacterium]NIM23925.1 quinate 5-dehydrogenase [Armatimonadota bacterium]NIM67772.1 quinate 5-dehydrogenase [Armatimonadota bacterium]NIM76312.1 quinate 5-dehydrogenase [Armatimonadota bacterium]NIN06006.1 quinate 5-dehydrogenase [Armatimonadota bacterium]